MTPPDANPASVLAETLHAENTALAALDFTVSGRLLEAKRAALAALPGSRPPAPLLARLRDLADENRRLLERALLVQGRVVGIIARAAPRAARGAPALYGPRGTMRQSPARPPISLSARC